MALGILGAFYLRARFAISPDAVYNHAMAKLNADPAVLEVLGGPVLGSELRAFVQTGGGLRLKWAVSASETPLSALSTPSTPRAAADPRPALTRGPSLRRRTGGSSSGRGGST